jgi:hypothetical protein
MVSQSHLESRFDELSVVHLNPLNPLLEALDGTLPDARFFGEFLLSPAR